MPLSAELGQMILLSVWIFTLLTLQKFDYNWVEGFNMEGLIPCTMIRWLTYSLQSLHYIMLETDKTCSLLNRPVRAADCYAWGLVPCFSMCYEIHCSEYVHACLLGLGVLTSELVSIRLFACHTSLFFYNNKSQNISAIVSPSCEPTGISFHLSRLSQASLTLLQYYFRYMF
jgi:hypothetical protein